MKYKIETTKPYDKWFAKLKDNLVRVGILARLARVENGNFGDFRSLGINLFEMRFFFGSGIRIYYTIKDNKIVILLAAGDKSSRKKIYQKPKTF